MGRRWSPWGGSPTRDEANITGLPDAEASHQPSGLRTPGCRQRSRQRRQLTHTPLDDSPPPVGHARDENPAATDTPPPYDPPAVDSSWKRFAVDPWLGKRRRSDQRPSASGIRHRFVSSRHGRSPCRLGYSPRAALLIRATSQSDRADLVWHVVCLERHSMLIRLVSGEAQQYVAHGTGEVSHE